MLGDSTDHPSEPAHALPPGHVPPEEAEQEGGMADDPRISPHEQQARDTLVTTYKVVLISLLDTVTSDNAPRVLSQVSQAAKAGIASLKPFGAYTLDAELQAKGPRGRRWGRSLDRETGGVHAMRELAGSMLDAFAPKQVSQLFEAANALDDEADRLVGQAGEERVGMVAAGVAHDAEHREEWDAAEARWKDGLARAQSLRARAAALRERAQVIAERLATKPVPTARGLARGVVDSVAGLTPDAFESSLGGLGVGSNPGFDAPDLDEIDV